MIDLARPKKYVVLITHSLGELEVLLPIFSRLKKDNNIHVEFIFAVKILYRAYKENKFYNYCVEQLGIKVSLRRLPNKFDFRHWAIAQSRFGSLAIKTYYFFEKYIYRYSLNRQIDSAHCLMHEISNQSGCTELIYRAQIEKDKTVITYHHGPGIIIDVIVTKKIENAENVVHLSFHSHNSRVLTLMGFEDQRVIGYPQFYPEWLQLIKEYYKKQSCKKQYVLILSRHVHPYYMDEDKYVYLLKTTCQVIRRCLGDILIVVKPHPREHIDRMKEVFLEIELDNYEVSNENPAVLAKGAMLSISYFGSSVLSALAMQIPAIEYFIEPIRFREAETNGSSYKNLGIDSAETPQELELFVNKVISGSYKMPQIVKDLSTQKSFEFFQGLHKQTRNNC